MNIPCQICEKRRARRFCPGAGGEICPGCCGAGRENTIDCPSTCDYLLEARAHERPIAVAENEIPNRDIRVTEEFLEQHGPLVVWLTSALAEAMGSRKAVDRDAGEALETLIKTYRTLQSGLIYETRPQNPYAAAIHERLKASIEDLSKSIAERSGLHTLRDADVLGVLVFLQRLQIGHNNGRPRGRMFYDFLRQSLPGPEKGADQAIVRI
ncbi:MAG TPA: hypothetical protein VKV74_01470 [Bryobacteraceae bacterium]|nr:hypothetical protein [Bryobacteraceae bacterium]